MTGCHVSEAPNLNKSVCYQQTIFPYVHSPTPAGPRYVVQIGDKVIDYNEDFCLFLATRNPSPFIPPDAASVVTEVNFTTTRAGLRGQVPLFNSSLTHKHTQSTLTAQPKVNLSRNKTKQWNSLIVE